VQYWSETPVLQLEVTRESKKLKGNLIKPHRDGKVHKVKVLMGKKGIDTNVLV